MDLEFEKKWRDTVQKLSENFEESIDLQSILFLIGIQELNLGFQKLSKSSRFLGVTDASILMLLSSLRVTIICVGQGTPINLINATDTSRRPTWPRAMHSSQVCNEACSANS